MNWDDIYQQIPQTVSEVSEEYIFKNNIIKDDIFRILEKGWECCPHGFPALVRIRFSDNGSTPQNASRINSKPLLEPSMDNLPSFA